MFDNCFGIWNDESIPVENIILKYDALDGQFLKSVPLHHSQRIIKDSDGEFIISLNIKNHERFRNGSSLPQPLAGSDPARSPKGTNQINI